MRSKKKKEEKEKGWFQGFGLRSWKDGAASYWDGKPVGEAIWEYRKNMKFNSGVKFETPYKNLRGDIKWAVG